MKNIISIYVLLTLLAFSACKKKEPEPAAKANDGGGGIPSDLLYVPNKGWEHVLDMSALQGHVWGNSGGYYLESYGLHKVGNEIRLYAAGFKDDQLGNIFSDPIHAKVPANSPGSNFTREPGVHAQKHIVCFDEDDFVYALTANYTTINSFVKLDMVATDMANKELIHHVAYGSQHIQAFPGGILMQADFFNLAILDLKNNGIKPGAYFHNINFDKGNALCQTADKKVYAPYIDRFGKLVITRMRDEKGMGHNDSIADNDRYYFAAIADRKDATDKSESAKIDMTAVQLANGKIAINLVVKNKYISQYLFDIASNSIIPVFEKKTFGKDVLEVFTLNTGRLVVVSKTYGEVYTIHNGLVEFIEQDFYIEGLEVERMYVSENYLYATIIKQGRQPKEPKLTVVRRKW